MQERIQQPLTDHANSSGTILAVSELWDANARLIDAQHLELARAMLADGFLDAAPSLTLAGNVLYWDDLKLVVQGAVCAHPAGNSNAAGMVNPLSPVLQAGNARIDCLVMEPKPRLTGHDWPQGFGVLRLISGPEAPLGSEQEPTDVDGLVVAKLQSVYGSPPVLLSHAVPRAAVAASWDEIAMLPAAGSFVYHASGALAGLVDHLEKVTPLGALTITFAYRSDLQFDYADHTLSLGGVVLKTKRVTFQYDSNGRLTGLSQA